MLKALLRPIVRPMQRRYEYAKLPAACKAEIRRDRVGGLGPDPGLDVTVREAISWLLRAQDHSASQDGGIAHSYSLVDGWGTSYPETTGYTIPTLLACASLAGEADIRLRVRRMLDWLVSIQFENGAFQGGRLGREPVVPVLFVTGQILMGLAAAVREFGDMYREPMRRTAQWVKDIQDSDGCWRQGRSPFAMSGEMTYETHVAWGLLEAARLEPDAGFGDAGLANIRWALQHQHENGWIAKCCLDDPANPFTHTIGYALRGIVEGYRFSQDPVLLSAARKTANGLLGALRDDGFLAGRLSSDWSGPVSWSCLTGTVQIAACWFILYQLTGDVRYRDAGCKANRYVRQTVRLDGDEGTRGAIKGTFPVDGGFHPLQYPNWAAKFFIDSHLLEKAAMGI
jgi:hypothetical protein